MSERASMCQDVPDGDDPASIRRLFPITERMLYLDAAHQTPLCRPVRDAFDRFLTESLESAGPKPVWLRRVESVRGKVAALLGAKQSEIAFTKNTSEGLNLVANGMPMQPGDNVLLIEGDHPNGAYAWLGQRRRGVQVRFVALDSDAAIADAETFRPYIDERTRAICLSHVSFHAGQRHDLVSIGRLCRDRGIHLIVDAMQSVGVVPIDLGKLNVSALAAGTHKGLLVPQGLGLLYVRDGLEDIAPTAIAMSSLADPPADFVARPDRSAVRRDAARFEAGNLCLPQIHGLGASLALIERIGVERIENHLLCLGDRLISRLDEIGIALVGPRARRHRAHVYVLDLPADDWGDYLRERGVCVSKERGGIRISFGVFNDIDDVDALAAMIRQRRAAVTG